MFHHLLVPIELTLLLGSLVPLMLRAMARHRKRLAASLPELFDRLQPLSRNGLEVVAGDMLEPTPDRIDLRGEARIEPSLTWTLLGGLEGLKVLEKNAGVLIDIAYFLQQWSTEAVEVTEHLRLSAQDIRREIHWLKRSLHRRGSDVSVPLRLQRIAGSYYLMTRRVIALVAISNSAMLPRLRDAL